MTPGAPHPGRAVSLASSRSTCCCALSRPLPRDRSGHTRTAVHHHPLLSTGVIAKLPGAACCMYLKVRKEV